MEKVTSLISKNRPLAMILLGSILIGFLDLSNIDRTLYKMGCLLLKGLLPAVCPDFYDLPIWEVGITFGTLTAAYYAYAGIRESNKRLELEQTPHVVFNDKIVTAADIDGIQRLHTVSLENVGKGRAINITATADPEGKISMIEGSNSHSIDLAPGGHYTSWAIDEGQVIKGLAKQGIKVISISNDIPDENILKDDEKDKADFRLFLWYEDQIGNHYKTTGKFRRAGIFLKKMENRVDKLR